MSFSRRAACRLHHRFKPWFCKLSRVVRSLPSPADKKEIMISKVSLCTKHNKTHHLYSVDHSTSDFTWIPSTDNRSQSSSEMESRLVVTRLAKFGW